MIKNLPAMPETLVVSLGWEDLLKKEMATHSSMLAWEIPWTEEPGKNAGVGCHVLLQGIFPNQGSNPGLPRCRWILYQLSHQGSSFPEISGSLPVQSRRLCLRLFPKEE